MKMALFFTRGVTLQQWLANGLFDREKLIYEHHLASGTLTQVHWLTYGSQDSEIAARLHTEGKLDRRIFVHSMPKVFALPYLGSWIYSFLLPFIHARTISNADLLKTNQLDGGWSAALAKRRLNKPLLVRCGYVQSKLEKTLDRLPPWRMALIIWGERYTYKFADAAVLTSYNSMQYINDFYKLTAQRLHVIPNYLDLNAFTPHHNKLKENNMQRVLFVGRLSPEKNLINLVRGASLAGIGIDIVGSGPQARDLKNLAHECGADMRLLGSLPNTELPNLLNQYTYFALTSLSEGMPKTLIEAMACGLICIGTDVEGINEVIKDGVNGFLSKGTDAESIHTTLLRALKEGSQLISQAARKTVMDHYAIDACAALEREVFVSLMTKCKH